jgi:uncharacterized protein (DUF488 family)
VDRPTVYTVGHSTRSLDELVSLLKQHGVVAVADVRRFPKSRKYPHFNDDALAASLPDARLRYVPIPALGGRRRTTADSVNSGWRNEGFRGYADYMQTKEFEAGVSALAELAAQTPTAIMCAEAVPWRCHRSLIADAMLVRGWQVLDIVGPSAATPHKLTPFARVEETRITYPAPAAVEGSDQSRPGLFDSLQ